jgi:glutathione peroxidase
MKAMKILGAALGLPALVLAAGASLYDIPLKDIDGKPTSLKAYEGKVLLVVNVASKCGLTPQYKALEGVYQKYKDRGLVVLGFPCNDFGNQEPGSNAEIKEFCSSNYDVSFPLFDKLHVKGPEQHPLYGALTGSGSPFPGEIAWNFGKFVVGRDGKILARFEPRTTPDAKEVTEAIEQALEAK